MSTPDAQEKEEKRIDHDQTLIEAAIGNLKAFQLMLLHMPPDQLAACYRILTGDDIGEADAAAHARLREKLIRDAIELLEAFRTDTSQVQDGNEEND